MHLYRGFLLIFVSGIVLLASMVSPPRVVTAQQTQRLVESVAITGNRRLRQDDIIYYVQTRPGDPFNQEQVQRDLQAILNLGFFDKTATRVLTEDGARGGNSAAGWDAFPRASGPHGRSARLAAAGGGRGHGETASLRRLAPEFGQGLRHQACQPGRG